MATLFPSTYEMENKVTPLDSIELNARWQSIDTRLDTLELKQTIAGILIPGTLTTGIKSRFVMPFSARNIDVVLGVVTAPTDADILVDVNKAGVTIFTAQANRPKIVDASTTGAFSVVANVTPLTLLDVIEIEIDQVGSTIAGADLMVIVRGERTA